MMKPLTLKCFKCGQCAVNSTLCKDCLSISYKTLGLRLLKVNSFLLLSVATVLLLLR
ncbi:hypothetical protein [Alkanindiges hydrocarboniclasticus]|uniref:hypothetical protein n=1 Tax=Alkanindiges hydrocarboniclasticus TaxID=1907941 RepID=UPI0013014201|nr:hypothetical protein [Alkanindiges hydrocarboniclasticus]